MVEFGSRSRIWAIWSDEYANMCGLGGWVDLAGDITAVEVRDISAATEFRVYVCCCLFLNKASSYHQRQHIYTSGTFGFGDDAFFTRKLYYDRTMLLANV